MNVIEVQFAPLNKTYWFDPQNHELKIGDFVIVKTELGTEIGKVIAFKKINTNDNEKKSREIKPILRKANLSDIDKVNEKNKNKINDLKICKKLIEKHSLDIKIIDLHYSFDGGRLTFYFTANGRVDFRNLVKDLTHKFQKSVRLHQIGARDEAKTLGEIGPCGKTLCCKKILSKLEQITSEHVDEQNIAHRGSDRLSGVCGRFKCWLKYEFPIYKELNQNLPPLGQRIKTEHGYGKVVQLNPLKNSVNICLEKDNKTIVEEKI